MYITQVSFKFWQLSGKDALTKYSVHIRQCGVMVMQAAVFEETPKLHTAHYKRVVCTFWEAELAVEAVDFSQYSHVAHYNEDYLHA